MSKYRIAFNEAYGEWWVTVAGTDELLAICETYKDAYKFIAQQRRIDRRVVPS